MRCQCKSGCEVEVKTPGKLFARGHDPASHQDYEKKGRGISRAIRKKIRAGTYVNHFKGQKHSAETKKQMSVYAQNRTPEHEANMLVGLEKRSKNKHWLAEVRKSSKKGAKRHAELYTGVSPSDEVRAKMSAYARNRTQEHQQNISAGLKRFYATPQGRRIQRARSKLGIQRNRELHPNGINFTPEVRKKMSESRKEGFRTGKIKPTRYWKGKTKHNDAVLARRSRQTKEDFRTGKRVSWDKGFTKETHPSIAKRAAGERLAYAEGRKKVTSRTFWQVVYASRRNGDITLRSKLELIYAQQLDKAHIKWLYESKRFPIVVHGISMTYTPDFYLVNENKFIEVKGRLTEQDEVKYKAFRKQHPDVKWQMLMSEDILRRT